jgi:starvation-inducible DNA-binding protein
MTNNLHPNTQETVKLLNVLLANETVLYIKTRKYHWNVTGPQFHDLHKFFESQYLELADFIDEIAEKIRALKGQAMGSLTEYLELTTLNEEPGVYPDSRQMLLDLIADHDDFIQRGVKTAGECEDKYGDKPTADFLIQLVDKHQKAAWMLRSTAGI